MFSEYAIVYLNFSDENFLRFIVDSVGGYGLYPGSSVNRRVLGPETRSRLLSSHGRARKIFDFQVIFLYLYISDTQDLRLW